jgi:hypothetical protein
MARVLFHDSDSADQPARRTFLRACLGTGLAAFALPLLGKSDDSPYREISVERLSLDRAGVWTLNFAYVPIRIIKVKTPDQGEKIVWYMVYYVYNKSDRPRDFIPEFELVTKDLTGKLGKFPDEPQPSVVEAIRKIEDPTGELKIQTSVSIAKNPIPVTSEDSIPRAVYGMAVWIDMPAEVPEAANFSVYVSGLSNGLSIKEQGDEILVSRKTLQIDFRRPTDNVRNRADDIRVNDNNGLGAEKWIYRESSKRKKPGAGN